MTDIEISEIERDMKERERTVYPFELKTVWSGAKEGRKFLLRALTLKEQSDAIKAALAYVKKNGIEDEDRQHDVKAVFCLYAAMFREPDKETPNARVPVFSDPETILKTFKPDELSVLGNCYAHVMLMESPFPQGIIANETVEQIAATLKLAPDAMQELLFKMTREQLTECLVRIVTDPTRYLRG